MEYSDVHRLFAFTWTHSLSVQFGGAERIVFDTDFGRVSLPLSVMEHCTTDEVIDLYVRQSGHVALENIRRDGLTWERRLPGEPMHCSQLMNMRKLIDLPPFVLRQG